MAKQAEHKFKYPSEYLKADGTLKKAYRKKAAAFRATHTQEGKRRKSASGASGSSSSSSSRCPGRVAVKAHCRGKGKNK